MPQRAHLPVLGVCVAVFSTSLHHSLEMSRAAAPTERHLSEVESGTEPRYVALASPFPFRRASCGSPAAVGPDPDSLAESMDVRGWSHFLNSRRDAGFKMVAAGGNRTG
ncbi:hypothetical protein AAFF_G00202730 [Aldrovandia affinis]|uniref:Uncharacterized protein n=1 Tax=Aldrovandia affinis TaxID=143900 RepID=A0AAD7WV19_9TELE|nr:hypothetical protein AAFF_G00202730 [Aldrovandia affinis]